MTKEQSIKVMEIVSDNVEEVLDKYLSYELLRRITSEIKAGVEWDLVNKMEDKG